jgi:SnoaL-like domain
VWIALISAVAGGLAAFFIPIALGPEPTSTATDLMDQEVQAATTHSTRLVASIYTPGAVLTDEGCVSSKPAKWQGLAEIESRYQQQLPLFLTLQHVHVAVTWNSGSRWRTSSGSDTAETVGTYRSGGSTQLQVITGLEAWSFVSDHGRWQISSFSFGRCGSSGGHAT